MNNLVGQSFVSGSTEYVIERIEAIDPALTNVIESMKKSGKDCFMFFCSKKLKSGKKSKQGGMFYRFTKTGHMLKVL